MPPADQETLPLSQVRSEHLFHPETGDEDTVDVSAPDESSDNRHGNGAMGQDDSVNPTFDFSGDLFSSLLVTSF